MIKCKWIANENMKFYNFERKGKLNLVLNFDLSFVEISSEHLHSQAVRARQLKLCQKVHLPPPVMCQMSCVMCHKLMSEGTYKNHCCRSAAATDCKQFIFSSSLKNRPLEQLFLVVAVFVFMYHVPFLCNFFMPRIGPQIT